MFRVDTRFTSEISPYECAEIITINHKNKLCISMSPGKKNHKWNRDVDLDIQAIVKSNINIIICLLEWTEIREMDIVDYPRKAQHAGLIFYHLPVKDLGCPSLNELKAIEEIIVKYLLRGFNVLVHCKEGLGRAGLICAACICNFGYTPKEAIELVRNQRKGAIQTSKQEQCIYQYYKAIKQI
jgi:ADP-ribosyl-[dinitrogen reductase] hydrolase